MIRICADCKETLHEVVLEDGRRMSWCERCWDMDLAAPGNDVQIPAR